MKLYRIETTHMNHYVGYSGKHYFEHRSTNLCDFMSSDVMHFPSPTHYVNQKDSSKWFNGYGADDLNNKKIRFFFLSLDDAKEYMGAIREAKDLLLKHKTKFGRLRALYKKYNHAASDHPALRNDWNTHQRNVLYECDLDIEQQKDCEIVYMDSRQVALIPVLYKRRVLEFA